MNINMSVIKTTLMASATTKNLLVLALVLLGLIFVILLLRLVNLLRKKPQQLEPAIQQVAMATPDGVAVAPAEPEETPLIMADDEPQIEEQATEEFPFEELTSDEDSEEEDFEIETVQEESQESVTIRYNRSFLAKYIQSSDEIKDYYVHLKNDLLSYKKVRARTSWKLETFSQGRNTVAKFIIRGKTLCICLALDPNEIDTAKYHIEDVSKMSKYAGTPCLYRVRNEKRLKYAYELIEMTAKKMNLVKTNRPSEDYYMPYEGVVQLIDKGLIKRVIRRNPNDFGGKKS